jgi:hypothetical protein
MKYRLRMNKLCVLGPICAPLPSCALPVHDDLGKQAYQAWVKDPNSKPGFLPAEGAMDRDSFIFSMKAVKDFEYSNYVLNPRPGTSRGEVGAASAGGHSGDYVGEEERVVRPDDYHVHHEDGCTSPNDME